MVTLLIVNYIMINIPLTPHFPLQNIVVQRGYHGKVGESSEGVLGGDIVVGSWGLLARKRCTYEEGRQSTTSVVVQWTMRVTVMGGYDRVTLIQEKQNTRVNKKKNGKQ